MDNTSLSGALKECQYCARTTESSKDSRATHMQERDLFLETRLTKDSLTPLMFKVLWLLLLYVLKLSLGSHWLLVSYQYWQYPF